MNARVRGKLVPEIARQSYLDTDLLREHKRLLKRFMKVSLTGHGVLLLVILIWNFAFPGTPMMIQPSIQIDVVALPDFTKNQIQAIDTSLPTKEDVKPIPPAVDVPPPTPDLMTLQKDEAKKQKEEAKPKDKAKTEESAKSALERLKKDLAKKEKVERERLVDEKKKELSKFDEKFRLRLAGNNVSTGNNVTGASAEVTNAYLGHVSDKIRSHWELPPFLQSQNLRASIRLYIEANGSIRYFLSKPSGNEIFDNLVKDAVERSKPFAPPPGELAGQLKRDGVEVLFPL